MDNNENEVTKDYTEEYKENKELNPNVEDTIELRDEFFEEKPKKKKIWLIILIVVLVLLIAGVLVYFLVIKKGKDEVKPTTPEIAKIERPSDNVEYTAIKQNPFGLYCNKTKSGEKITKLTKNMIIDCDFSFELKQRVSEVYFDLDTSSFLKLDEYKNDSDYTVETDGKTYKLSTASPAAVFSGTLKFYYKVTKADEQNGYIELKDVIFKDENNAYYKVLNNLTTIPPEYEDKLYIYETTYEEDESGEVYYYSSKTKYEDEKLYDTFQCKNESCDEKASFDNYFLILDDGLILYDTVNKTRQDIKTDGLDFEKYTYELMQTKDNKIYGIAFKQNYHDELDCEKFEDICVNLGLSGYDLGYYSLSEKMFTIDPELGFFGATAFNEYDKALLLKKGNKYGIFSYDDDEMILELTNKYTAMTYDSELDVVLLEMLDTNKNEYYYTLYDIDKRSFKVDVSKYNKLSSTLYSVSFYNRNGKVVTLLYNDKGEQLKLLPYVLSDDLVQVSKFITIKNTENLYELYDLTGKFLYKSKYQNPDILTTTASYLLIINENNIIELFDLNGNKIVDVLELKTGVSFIKANENNKVLTVYVKDTSVEEENKNGYKYTVNENGQVSEETVNIE